MKDHQSVVSSDEAWRERLNRLAEAGDGTAIDIRNALDDLGDKYADALETIADLLKKHSEQQREIERLRGTLQDLRSEIFAPNAWNERVDAAMRIFEEGDNA